AVAGAGLLLQQTCCELGVNRVGRDMHAASVPAMDTVQHACRVQCRSRSREEIQDEGVGPIPHNSRQGIDDGVDGFWKLECGAPAQDVVEQSSAVSAGVVPGLPPNGLDFLRCWPSIPNIQSPGLVLSVVLAQSDPIGVD